MLQARQAGQHLGVSVEEHQWAGRAVLQDLRPRLGGGERGGGEQDGGVEGLPAVGVGHLATILNHQE